MVTFAACAAAPVAPGRSATVDVVTADVPKLGVQAGEANLTLRVNNAGAPLTLSSAELSLDLQGARIAEALLALNQIVPSGTAEAVQLQLPLALQSLPPAVADRLASGDAIELVARGFLKGKVDRFDVALPFQALRQVHPVETEATHEGR